MCKFHTKPFQKNIFDLFLVDPIKWNLMVRRPSCLYKLLAKAKEVCLKANAFLNCLFVFHTDDC